MDAKKAAIAQTLRDDPNRSVREICETLGISQATFHRYTRPLPGVDLAPDFFYGGINFYGVMDF